MDRQTDRQVDKRTTIPAYVSTPGTQVIINQSINQSNVNQDNWQSTDRY